MKNRSWMFLVLLLFELAIILVLVPGGWMDKVIEKEKILLSNRMGEEQADRIKERSLEIYQNTLINSGVYSAVHDHLIPKKQSPRGFDNVGTGWFAWVDGRLIAFSKLYYHAIMRSVLIWSWIPYLLILLIPAIIDGVCKWKINRESFDDASLIVHRGSYYGITLLFVLTIAIFIAPIPLEPLVLPAAAMILCVLIGSLIGNMQKQM